MRLAAKVATLQEDARGELEVFWRRKAAAAMGHAAQLSAANAQLRASHGDLAERYAVLGARLAAAEDRLASAKEAHAAALAEAELSLMDAEGARRTLEDERGAATEEAAMLRRALEGSATTTANSRGHHRPPSPANEAEDDEDNVPSFVPNRQLAPQHPFAGFDGRYQQQQPTGARPSAPPPEPVERYLHNGPAAVNGASCVPVTAAASAAYYSASYSAARFGAQRAEQPKASSEVYGSSTSPSSSPHSAPAQVPNLPFYSAFSQQHFRQLQPQQHQPPPYSYSVVSGNAPAIISAEAEPVNVVPAGGVGSDSDDSDAAERRASSNKKGTSVGGGFLGCQRRR